MNASFGGFSPRRFGRLALSCGFGEPGGAVARQSLLGETMLFALMFRRGVLRCFTHFRSSLSYHSIVTLSSVRTHANAFKCYLRTVCSRASKKYVLGRVCRNGDPLASARTLNHRARAGKRGTRRWSLLGAGFRRRTHGTTGR